MKSARLFTYLGKDFRFLKYFFFVLTFIWLIDELWNYLVVRPTMSSISLRYLESGHIPQILLCPSPAHDLQALLSLGYDNSMGQDELKRIIIHKSKKVLPTENLQQ